MSTDPQGQVDPLRRATLGRQGLLAALACGAVRGETREVVYGWPESMLDDARSELPITLLTRALQRSGAGYALRPARRDLTQSRTLRHLRQGRGGSAHRHRRRRPAAARSAISPARKARPRCRINGSTYPRPAYP